MPGSSKNLIAMIINMLGGCKNWHGIKLTLQPYLIPLSSGTSKLENLVEIVFLLLSPKHYYQTSQKYPDKLSQPHQTFSPTITSITGKLTSRNTIQQFRHYARRGLKVKFIHYFKRRIWVTSPPSKYKYYSKEY